MAMFVIVWLKAGIPIEKETTLLASEAEAIAPAVDRASSAAKRHRCREPDSFRLTDATGRILGVYPIE
jgi:hypothetical protein